MNIVFVTRLPLREWFTKRPRRPVSAVASILEKIIKHVFRLIIIKLELLKFNKNCIPIILVVMSEVVHVTTSSVILSIVSLPFACLCSIDQFARIFNDKLASVKLSQSHNTSTFTFEASYLETYITYISISKLK